MSLVVLPIDSFLPAILQSLKSHANLVLVAEPGAGKTTRVPPAIVRSELLSKEHPNLVMLQPRRVAARAAAMRIGEEQGWTLGKEVGYHVRFDRKIARETRLRVLTEGILTRQLVDDPFLEGIGCVVLDEFHERSLHSDICVALLREVQQTVRPDLKIVAMSATLEAEPVAKFLGDAPIVRVPGRTFPVDISYRANDGSYLESRVRRTVEDALANDGDVLVFLPGVGEINRAMDAVSSIQADLLVLPLHGTLSAEEQMRALRPTRQRKVILATNIAETSLTIEGVTTVIDSGLARVASFDVDRGMDRLDLSRISQASAKQRAGRAGRTSHGRCIRLWSEKEQNALDAFELPEIRRVDLSATILSLHAWGKSDVRGFGWFESPTEEQVQFAEELLEMLGALREGKLTKLGEEMVKLPLHPRLARLMIEGDRRGLGESAATIGAILSEKDFVIREASAGASSHGFRNLGASTGTSDVLVRMELLKRSGNVDVDFAAIQQVKRVREELLRYVKPGGRDGASEEEALKLVLMAYPDRVCRRREKDARAAAIVGGGAVRLSEESVVRTGEFFVAIDARHDPRNFKAEAQVRIASRVEEEWLEDMFPQSIREVRRAEFDAERGRVMTVRQILYRDLVLRESRDGAVDREAAGAALFDAMKSRVNEFFETDDAIRNLIARLALLQKAMPEHPWPAMDEAGRLELLREACDGARSVEELRNRILETIRGRLNYPLDRLLDQHAPETIEVPSGSHIKIEYELNRPPKLSARLQELFGWTETPRIAGGRVPILIHLLAPNYRPVQITEDLKNFWAKTYFDVRKELKVRYPKHAWPDDPLTAPAEAKGRRRS